MRYISLSRILKLNQNVINLEKLPSFFTALLIHIPWLENCTHDKQKKEVSEITDNSFSDFSVLYMFNVESNGRGSKVGPAWRAKNSAQWHRQGGSASWR